MDHHSEIEQRRKRLEQQKQNLISFQSLHNTRPHSQETRREAPPSSHDRKPTNRRFLRAPKAELNLPPSHDISHDESKESLSGVAISNKGSYLSELMGDAKFSSKFDLVPTEGDQQNKSKNHHYSASQHASDRSPLQFRITLKNDVTELRPTTAIKFHRKFDDIVVTSHGSRSDKRLSSEPGLNAIWRLDEGRSTLQRTLTANAAISAIELPSISPTLVIGGTVSGSVLFWDTRMKTSLPVHALEGNTAFVTGFHDREKVTAVKCTASSSPYFVSTSNGGHVCKWTLSKPDVPITRDTLRENATSAELNISSFDFPRSARLAGGEKTTANRFASLLIGGEDGGIYRADGNDSSWTVETALGKNHEAKVTAVSAHPFGHHVAFLDNVLLSASADWTLKLWYFHKSHQSVCIDTFDMVEYGRVNDVAWSNQHPTVFCAGSEAGYLSLFDISNRLLTSTNRNCWHFDMPDVSHNSEITSVQWDRVSKNVCAGSSNGTIFLWQCTSDFASLPDAEWTGQYLKSKQNVLVQ